MPVASRQLNLSLIVGICSVFALLSGVGGCSGRSGSSLGTPSVGSVQVEVDIFSGRENPHWSLSPSSFAVVRECLESSTSAPITPPPVFNALGFRRFLLTDLPSELGLSQVSVMERYVIATRTDQGSVSFDDCGRIFTTLRREALDHLSREEITAIPEGKRS